MSMTETETKQTTIAALKPPAAKELVIAPGTAPGFLTLESFELMQRVSKMFASSDIVPERYRGNIANCSIALEMAGRLRASPLMVMQNLYVVYGSPGWAAKFLIACFNQSGKYTAIRYAFEGSPNKDDWGCRAWAIEIATQEKLFGPLITIALSKAEGWYSKKGSKWPTMGEQMLRYRSAAWFINTVAPEISMGLPTAEELGDTFNAEQNPDGSYGVTTESLRKAAAGPAPESRVIDAEVIAEGEKKAAEAQATPPEMAPEAQSDAINSLREAGSKDDLAQAWKLVKKTYKAAGVDMPGEVESAYIESLAQIEKDLAS